jgi:hypothetical protein
MASRRDTMMFVGQAFRSAAVAFGAALCVAAAVASCSSNGEVTLLAGPGDGGAFDATNGRDGSSSRDGAAPNDGGAPIDSGIPVDGGAPGDGAVPADGGTPIDSGVPLDAGADSPADAAATDAAADAPPADAAHADGGGTCTPVTQPCDVVCQNCGGTLRCDPISAMYNDGGEGAYCTNSGGVAPDQQCGTNSGVDDCAPGGICLVQRSSPPLDTCAEMCRTDADCKNGGLCAYGPFNGTTVKICTPKVTGCDPVADTGCAANTGCYLLTSMEATGCHIAGTLGQDQPCTSEYDCRGGFACGGFPNADGGYDFRCAQYCHTATNDCPGADAGTHACYTINGYSGPYGFCGP